MSSKAILYARLQDLEFVQRRLDVLCGLRKRTLVALSLRIRMAGDVVQYEFCLSEKEEVGLLVISFTFVDACLQRHRELDVCGIAARQAVILYLLLSLMMKQSAASSVRVLEDRNCTPMPASRFGRC